MTNKHARGVDAKVSSCMWTLIEYAGRHHPEIVVFESVQQAFTNKDGHAMMRALRSRLEDLTGDQYGLWHVKHNAYSVGGPAQRRRYFWLASKVPFGVEEPELVHTPVLEDIISDLENLSQTWYAQPYRSPAHPYTTQFLSETHTVDGHIGLDVTLTRRIEALAKAIDWQPRESISMVTKRYYEKFGRLPDEYPENQTAKLVSKDFKMGFTIPARWDPKRHARVVTGGGLVMVVHPYLPRCITHREAARILGFPDDWTISPLRTQGNNLAYTWGKGITTHAGKWVGSWIKSALDGVPGSMVGTQIGDREHVIDVTNSWQKYVSSGTPRENLVRSMI